MKPFIKFKRMLFVIMLFSLSSHVYSEISVDKSNGVLNITSDIDGTVSAKIIGPDNVVVVDESFSGSSFSWSPSSGPDGAYRYDVRVTSQLQNEGTETESRDDSKSTNISDYAGGSIEVVNGQIKVIEEESK